MEQPKQPIGGFNTSPPKPISSDAMAIHHGIQTSRLGEHDQDDATARRIASQLHGGQASALYSLASSGNIDEGRLQGELEAEYRQQEDPRVREWIHWLGAYCLRRPRKGPVDGWHDLTADRAAERSQNGAIAATTETEHDQPADDEHARQALMERITAAGATTLGQVATIYTAEGTYGSSEPDDQAEADVYPWLDAARWRPDGGSDELDGPAGADSALLEELFTRLTDAEFGSRDEMGWCGLLRHEGRPGGAILHQNQYGRHWAWSTDSDDELAARWHQLQEEHEAYRYSTERRETQRSTEDVPHIWVGSLADYTAGYLHGAWLDATLEPDDLTNAVQFVLRNSHEPDAEEYGVFDYDGFGHEVTSLLGEYPSLTTISKIAQGIAEHGPAFAAWAAYVGPEQTEQLDRFEDHYLGEWESIEAYADDLLQETEAYRVIEEAPEWLRPYLQVDVEGYARDLSFELHVVERPDGGVWVFDSGS